jgi:hypothetical protein
MLNQAARRTLGLLRPAWDGRPFLYDGCLPKSERDDLSTERVWLATGHTDMRKGFDGLALWYKICLTNNAAERALRGHAAVFTVRIRWRPLSSGAT